jgi:hypothetical protein
MNDKPNNEKNFGILKEYFTENICRDLYQSMDLLNSTQTDFDQYKNMYVTVAKDLVFKVLLAVNTLVAERQYGHTNQIDTKNKYSICQSYLLKKNCMNKIDK